MYTDEIIDLCNDPLCNNEATHDMRHMRGYRIKMCPDHLKMVLDAAQKAALTDRELAVLDIRPIEKEV